MLLLPLFLASPALAQATAAAGGKNNPLDVAKGGLCGANSILGIITSPILVGIALALVMAYMGWQLKVGGRDSVTIATRGIIGAVVILGAAFIGGAFVAGC